MINADGWLHGVRRVPSPNFDERPAGMPVELLVIHAISLPPGRFGGPWIDDLFCNRLEPQADPFFAGIAALRVSSHLLIRRDGELVQYVALGKRAWHAGASEWQGRGACNDFSIGIELEGCDEVAYEEAQYRTLLPLLAALRGHFPQIRADAVVGHCDIAPGRKSDPGPYFDWARVRSSMWADSSAEQHHL